MVLVRGIPIGTSIYHHEVGDELSVKHGQDWDIQYVSLFLHSRVLGGVPSGFSQQIGEGPRGDPRRCDVSDCVPSRKGGGRSRRACGRERGSQSAPKSWLDAP